MKTLSLLMLLFLVIACASDEKESDWDSGSDKTQSYQIEDNAELQNSTRNQAPTVIPQ